MKICALMITMPHDEEYMVQCLHSLLKLDHIVITCPTKYMWQWRTNKLEIKDQDRTLDYIESMRKKYHGKIHTVFSEGWESANEQWQAGFDKMNELKYTDDDAFIISMPDEVWDGKELNKLIKLTKERKFNYSPDHLVFHGDFGWVGPGAEGRNYMFNRDMKLEAITKNAAFVYPSRGCEARMGGANLAHDIKIHHFKWVHNLPHLKQKAEWNNQFYSKRPRENPVDVINKWMNARETTNVKMNLDASPAFTVPYKGTFPAIMKSHPYYGKDVKEILEYKGEYI